MHGWSSAPDPAGKDYSAPPDPRGLLLRGEDAKGQEGRTGEGTDSHACFYSNFGMSALIVLNQP